MPSFSNPRVTGPYPPRRKAKAAALCALGLLALGATGCRLSLNSGGALGGALGPGGGFGGLAGGGGPGSGGGFQAPRAPGASNFNNPRLGGPGAAGSSLAPGSTLPPPQAIPGQYAKVFQAYGVRVGGPMATGPVLETIARALQHYSPENTRGIQTFNCVPMQPGSSTTGLWQMRNGLANITLWGRQNSPEPVKLRTAVHEIGHHWSLSSDRQGGNALDQALGSHAGAYVSPYAQTDRSEKLAEATAFFLVGAQEFSKEMQILPSWNPSPAAQAVVRTRIVAGRRPI